MVLGLYFRHGVIRRGVKSLFLTANRHGVKSLFLTVDPLRTQQLLAGSTKRSVFKMGNKKANHRKFYLGK